MNIDKKFDYQEWIKDPYCLCCKSKIFEENYLRCVKSDHYSLQSKAVILIGIGSKISKLSFLRNFELIYSISGNFVMRKTNNGRAYRIKDDLLTALK